MKNNTKIISARLERDLAGALEADAAMNDGVTSYAVRRAIIMYLRIEPLERQRIFETELTRAIAELRRIGGLYALQVKTGQTPSVELKQLLNETIAALKTASQNSPLSGRSVRSD